MPLRVIRLLCRLVNLILEIFPMNNQPNVVKSS